MGLKVYLETVPSFGKRVLLAGYGPVTLSAGNDLIDNEAWSYSQQHKATQSGARSLVPLPGNPDVLVRVWRFTEVDAPLPSTFIYGVWSDEPDEDDHPAQNQ